MERSSFKWQDVFDLNEYGIDHIPLKLVKTALTKHSNICIGDAGKLILRIHI